MLWLPAFGSLRGDSRHLHLCPRKGQGLLCAGSLLPSPHMVPCWPGHTQEFTDYFINTQMSLKTQAKLVSQLRSRNRFRCRQDRCPRQQY